MQKTISLYVLAQKTTRNVYIDDWFGKYVRFALQIKLLALLLSLQYLSGNWIT